jgi:predicted AlkP superfamily phosphohydrolase/phosphomutase
MGNHLTRNPPLLIVGFDGGDRHLIDRWVQEGHLPTIASILERGCRGRIEGPELMSTHGAWLSLFSGVSRREHGYYANVQLAPGTYDFRTYTARDTAALPFWSRLRGGPKRVTVIDALETEPLSGISGSQLSHWAVQQQYNRPTVPSSSEPGGLVDEVRRHIGSPIPVEVFKPDSSLHEDMDARRLLLERIAQKGAICRRLVTQDRCDVAVVTFVEAHTAAHRFWDYRPGGIRHQRATDHASGLSTAIRDVYHAIDRQLALLIDEFPEEPNVFVISLFGVKDLYPTTGLIDAFCRQLQYEVPSEGGGTGFDMLDTIRRTVPFQVRARISRLLPYTVQARLDARRFRTTTDWSRTRAFSIPSLNTSFVRVNLRGREPLGIVEPGFEYERLLSQIEDDLEQLVDVRSGQPAVENIIRTATAFQCGPPPVLPDLSVEWRAAPYLMHQVRHPRGELIQTTPEYNRSSYHTFTGCVAAAGPSVPSGDLGDLSPLEFAPLFLSLMGEPSPRGPAERLISRFAGASPFATTGTRTD